MAGSHGIKKETYVQADEKTRIALTFDFFDAIYCRLAEGDKRIKKLENRKKLDTGVSGAFGFIGGFVAMFVRKLFP